MFDDDEREQLPVEAQAMHQRLMRDSSRWARRVPAETRVAEFARTVPQRMPAPTIQRTPNVLAHRRPRSTRPDEMSSEGQRSMFTHQRPARTLVASIAALAVVALLVGVLYTIHSTQGTGGGSGGDCSTGTETPQAQGDYGATPGPLANYVSELYTTGGNPTNGAPVTVTSHFVTGDQVYVVTKLHDLAKGEHTISIEWYMSCMSISPGLDSISAPDLGDKLLYFNQTASQPGAYMARIYIDRPVIDTSDSPNDPYLAGTIIFVVESSQPTPTTTSTPSA